MADVYELFPGMRAGNETDKERAKRCLGKIAEALKEENCIVVPDFRIVGLEISSGIIILAKPYDVPMTTPN